MNQALDLELLRKWAMCDPNTWAEHYDNEMVRRHPMYQQWLTVTKRLDNPKNLAYYRSGGR